MFCKIYRNPHITKWRTENVPVINSAPAMLFTTSFQKGLLMLPDSRNNNNDAMMNTDQTIYLFLPFISIVFY